MGAEMLIDMGAWAYLGWLLDAQRNMACAPRAVPRAWKFVSLPCDLDIATLDTRYGLGVANAIGGVNSNDWYCAPVLAPIECSPMGGRAFAHVVVIHAAPGF
jgi:hypothetical protein